MEHLQYSGIVQKGKKQAMALGFPTINIPLSDTALSGIFVGRVYLGEKTYPAAVFADPERRVLEAHLLDTQRVLYGEHMTIELLEKIRDTMQFKDRDDARAWIQRDIQYVKEYFVTS